MNEPSFADGYGRQGVTLLVVRPHPDDESIATGGMLASYSARSVRTGVVICTGGEEGQILDPHLDPVADMPRLREIRAQEIREACTILGVAVLRMLGYRDSGMPGTPANEHPEAFAKANPVAATGRLVRIIRALRPLVMVTEPLGGIYAHPDHVTCHRVSVDAFHAAGDAQAYPEAGPPWRVAKLYAIAQIDDGCWDALRPEFTVAGINMAWLERRRHRSPGPETATVAHRTQIPWDSFLVSLPADLRRRAFATAYFLRLHPPIAPGAHEQDLLDGLDVLAGMG